MKNLESAFGRISAVCQQYVGCMFAVYQPFVCPMSAICQPYDSRGTAVCQPGNGRMQPYVRRISAVYPPYVSYTQSSNLPDETSVSFGYDATLSKSVPDYLKYAKPKKFLACGGKLWKKIQNCYIAFNFVVSLGSAFINKETSIYFDIFLPL